MLDRRFLDVSIVVAGIANSPAASPTAGTQYIVGSSPAGDFSGAKANQLARYDGSKWIFSTPKTNSLEVLNVETKEVLSFDGTTWTAKVTLAQAKSTDNFIVADYFSNKSHYYEPSTMTGYTPDEYVGIYYGSQNDENGKNTSFGFIYKANSEGKLEKVEKESLFGKTILSIKNDDDKYNGPFNEYGSFVFQLAQYTLNPDAPNVWFYDKSRDFVFCKQTSHFYKYDKTDKKYVDLGAVSESDFTQIDGGVFFYYAATNSFYYVDTENGTFAVIPLGGNSDTGSTAIAPIKGIVDTLPTADITSGDRYALTSDFKIHEYNGTEWTATDVPVGGMFLNKADSLVYVYDGENFVATGGSGGTASEVICETHTLTAEEATAKSFTLANSIASGKETDVFLSVCGMVQIAGVDYTASENTISWSDKTLADIGLQAGDVFLVQYTKA